MAARSSSQRSRKLVHALLESVVLYMLVGICVDFACACEKVALTAENPKLAAALHDHARLQAECDKMEWEAQRAEAIAFQRVHAWLEYTLQKK